MPKTKTVLMCPPTHFDIEYEINEWMNMANPVDHAKAKRQWQNLYDVYTQKLGWSVELIEPVKGLPDMVFTANGGLVHKGKVVLPRFRYPQRQPETERFEAWFKSAGFSKIYMPEYNFEGAGDAFIWNGMLFGGYPFRGDKRAHQEVAEYLGLKPVSLEQVDPRFYHLDTSITFLSPDSAAIYMQAFSEQSQKILRQLIPIIIEAPCQDALVYGLNSMHEGQDIVLSNSPQDLIERYKQLGMNIYTADMSEFQKSGGGVKCLTLELS